MLRRKFAVALAIVPLLCAACGGSPRAATADMVAIRQPTPDPTLDAVVRDLPRALAGVIAPTPTPTAVVIVAPTARPKPPTPTSRPASHPIPATVVVTKATLTTRKP